MQAFFLRKMHESKCIAFCQIYGQGAKQLTVRSRPKETCGTLPLSSWYYNGACETSSQAVQLPEKSADLEDNEVEESTVMYQQGSTVAIVPPGNTIDPFWLIEMQEDVRPIVPRNDRHELSYTSGVISKVASTVLQLVLESPAENITRSLFSQLSC